MIITRWMQLSFCALAAMGTAAVAARGDDINDYPTNARVEYVFGCMKANGETRQTIEQCSCSIDVLASLLPYDRYVTAETVLSMSQVRGNLGGQFRSSEQANSALNDLRRAQAEAEVRCVCGQPRSFPPASAGSHRSNAGAFDLPLVAEDVALRVLCLDTDALRAIGDVGEPDIRILGDGNPALHRQHQAFVLPDPQFVDEEGWNIEL